jgi:carbon-monoxide dehydrogenase large subunit
MDIDPAMRMPSNEGAAAERAGFSIIGKSVTRVEDARFLRGRGRYIADIRLPGMREVAFVRSAVAHGRIRRLAPPAGLAASEFWTAGELAPLARPVTAILERDSFRRAPYPILADGRVRFVGELIAAVVADTRARAEDIAEHCTLEIDPLPVVVDAKVALGPGAPRLHDAWPDNCYMRIDRAIGDVEGAIRTADIGVTRHYRMGRALPSPLEPRGCIAWYDRRSAQLNVYVSTQRPHLIRSFLAEQLVGLDERRIRVVTPDVGGAFGGKTNLYPEEVALAAIAMQVPYPVRWIEDRYEHLVAACHAREHIQTVSLYARRSGEIVALDAQIIVDGGAYSMCTSTGAIEANMAVNVLPGPYRIATYRFEAISACTNKTPLGPFRGVGRPGACFAMERTIDELADELGMEPADLRRINLLRPDEFPFQTATGLLYDSGNYRAMIETATASIRHQAIRKEQSAMPPQARRRIGVGYAAYVEQTAHGAKEFISRGSPVLYGFESARVTLDQSSTLTVHAAVLPQGQGLETTLAQIASEVTTLPMEQISVRFGDTESSPYGMGSVASRSMVMAGGATFHACVKLMERVRRIGAALLGCAMAELIVRDGIVIGPAASIPFAKIAHVAWQHVHLLPPDVEPGLEFLHNYRPDVQSGTFSSGLHATKVAVDLDTGKVELLDYVVVEDCGKAINPMIVDGQVIGGVAQGIGQALFENLAYDENGQPKAVTLADYVLPGFEEVPDVRIEHMETPSPFTVYGMKGTGEGGAIAPPAAIANAVTDALRPLGVSVACTPITSASIWCALDEARRKGVRAFTREIAR